MTPTLVSGRRGHILTPCRQTNTWRARRRRGCGTALSGCASAAGTPTPAPPGAPGAPGTGPGQPSSAGCERSEPTEGTPSPCTHPLPHCTSVCPGACGHPRVAATSTQHQLLASWKRVSASVKDWPWLSHHKPRWSLSGVLGASAPWPRQGFCAQGAQAGPCPMGTTGLCQAPAASQLLEGPCSHQCWARP